MSLTIENIYATTTGSGVGVLTLTGEAFRAEFGNGGSRVRVLISEQDGASWEDSICTYNGASNTITRHEVIASSSGRDFVAFAGGIKDVAIVMSIPASQAAAVQSLVTPATGLTGVTYDGSNRAVGWTINGVSYSANYAASRITLASSGGAITDIDLDPAGRITGMTTV